MISEIYVPRAALADFLAEAREDFRANAVNLIYGTVRLIERDDESFLAWATPALGLRDLQPARRPRRAAAWPRRRRIFAA